MINIKIDSRKIENGDIFVALPGATVDGHDYVSKAYEKGAVKTAPLSSIFLHYNNRVSVIT